MLNTFATAIYHLAVDFYPQTGDSNNIFCKIANNATVGL